jgi:hypothetical protein
MEGQNLADFLAELPISDTQPATVTASLFAGPSRETVRLLIGALSLVVSRDSIERFEVEEISGYGAPVVHIQLRQPAYLYGVEPATLWDEGKNVGLQPFAYATRVIPVDSASGDEFKLAQQKYFTRYELDREGPM